MIRNRFLSGSSILTLFGMLLFSLSASAQETPEQADSLREAALREFARAPVPSCPVSLTGDTLETTSPGIRIILNPDGTWRPIRDPELIRQDSLFIRNWDIHATDPYHLPLEKMPQEWQVWVLDSLDQYHCPNQIAVHSPYGFRHGRRHQGVDLPLKTGDPVYAAFDGMVRLSESHGAYGNLVVLRHKNGLETFYAHLSERLVQPGDWVSAGQVIALGGSTGRSTGPHLHFETRWQGYAFDPQRLIDFKTGTLRHRLFTLRRRYFDGNSKYVQSDDDEEVIAKGDEEDRKKAEEQRKKEEAAAQKWHTIKNGDTLSGIAHKYHTSVNAICRLNSGLKPNTTLKIGRKIRVR